MKNDIDLQTVCQGGDKCLLTAAEVAKLMRVSKGTIYRWVKRGRIPFVKIGDMIRFDASSLRSWMARGTSTPGGCDEK